MGGSGKVIGNDGGSAVSGADNGSTGWGDLKSNKNPQSFDLDGDEGTEALWFLMNIVNILELKAVKKGS